MSDNRVRRLLGDPTETNAYMTEKSWIPFYYGIDTFRLTEEQLQRETRFA